MSSLKRGFTLIELMVVAAIIVVISSIVLANNGRFGGVVLLQNLAYDMALTFRQAQVYGISVQRFGTSFNAGYGIHLDLNAGDQTQYELFADASTPQDGIYESGELVSTTYIKGGYYVAQLCATPLSGSEQCDTAQTGGSLDVIFIRPEPDAMISFNGNSCILNSSDCQQSARVVLESPRGDLVSVEVDNNGQISVHSQ